MIRRHENAVSVKAGVLAIGVHTVLLIAMLISINWKAAHQVMNVTEVELWDKLPTAQPTIIKTEPKPESKPVLQEKPKEEPKPVVIEKPKIVEPKVDIELEKKKLELVQKEKELEEKHKKEEMTKKLAQQMRDEDLRDKKATEKKQLDKIKQDALSDIKAQDDKQASAANASLIGEYTDKIKTKIRGNVNKTLCGDGNPQLVFEIGLLPTGELSSAPKLTKSSGIAACDDAVERAIAESVPLPLPSDPAIYSKFRNLNLKFRPND